MPHPPQLTVEIRRIGEGHYLAITSRAGGAEVCQSTFAYSPDLLRHMEPQWLLERAVPRHAGEELRRGPADAGSLADEERKLADYGRELYGFLFGDGARFRQFLEFNDDYRRGARLTLALHRDAASLWRLPWEYLCDDAGFLALSGRLLLSRTPLGLGELSPAPVEPPLRILVVVAAPDDQRPLDTEEEIRLIQESLDEAVQVGRVQVDYLDDATLPAIGDALRQLRPHILHYTGHGAYDQAKGASFLALEDEDGRTRLAGIADLKPYLAAADFSGASERSLRLALLSGCQTARTSDMDAFAGIATGLLAEGVPAVLAMQSSILDPSAIELARAFYAAIAEGATPLEAAQRSRLALKNAADGPGYDWGVPSLYLRAPNLRLVADVGAGLKPAPTRPALVDVGGLPLPPHFVGRKKELRDLRHALADSALTAAFVRGIGGMGKSTIAAKLIQRPGVPLDGVLVIRCNQVAPLDIPAKLASWLAARGAAGHAEAAGLLLDSRADPADRTRQALAMLGRKRYLVVFDNFESVMAAPTLRYDDASTLSGARRMGSTTVSDPQPAPVGVEGAAKGSEQDSGKAASFDSTPLSLRSAQDARGVSGGGASVSLGESALPVADPTLAGFFEGLLDAQWRGMCLFTGRYRWAALDERLGRGSAVEAQLPGLTLSQAVMLMDNLPRLRRQPLATKTAVYRKVGGHPKSIELLEGWLASGRITDLLADGRLDGMLADQWAGYFLDALLAQLTAAERDALTRLCIFETLLDDDLLAYAEIEPAWLARWLDLSLLQREGGAAAPVIPPHMQGVWDLLPESERRKLASPAMYTVHPVVREYLTGRRTDDERRRAHEWAAEFYGRPFVEMVRQAAAHSGERLTENEIKSTARTSLSVVGQLAEHTGDVTAAYAMMGRALTWRYHLVTAGAYDPAEEIRIAVVPTLILWGQRDLAKKLLEESFASGKGITQLSAQMDYATLLRDEGKLIEALAIYEAVYHAFETAGTKSDMAAVLGQMSNAYELQGEIGKAFEACKSAMTIWQDLGDDESQAMCLHRLSALHMRNEDYTNALARTREAETMNRSLCREVGIARNLQQKGVIYARLARAATDDVEADRYIEAAYEYITESLAIKSRIGDVIGAANSLAELGNLLRDTGRMREAIEVFNKALEIFTRLSRSQFTCPVVRLALQ